jgi:hypothetical protein
VGTVIAKIWGDGEIGREVSSATPALKHESSSSRNVASSESDAGRNIELPSRTNVSVSRSRLALEVKSILPTAVGQVFLAASRRWHRFILAIGGGNDYTLIFMNAAAIALGACLSNHLRVHILRITKSQGATCCG